MEDNQIIQGAETENTETKYMDIENIGTGGQQKKHSSIVLVILAGIIILLAAGEASAAYVMHRPPKGCEDYTIQMQQYYVEYSDEYDYWDVLTIEYPEIEGIGEEQQSVINEMMYDAAMDRSNYWHFEPDDYVKELQKEYSIFSSDVECTVKYHSQYLVSLYYAETYAPANPVWYASMTKRGLNVDLLTGEQYKLTDIILLDPDFIEFWGNRANEHYDDFFGDEEEDRELLLKWFLQEDEEWNEYYEFQPYFYVTDSKEFIIGIAIDPKYISAHEPQEDFYEIRCDTEELESFKTESEFWEKYDLSEPAGQVKECTELQSNLWLGDMKGVWDYWEEKGDLLSR